MKENSLTKKNKDMEFLYGPMEANIWEILLMILDKGMVKCIGLMEIFIKDSGIKVYKYNKFYNQLILICVVVPKI